MTCRDIVLTKWAGLEGTSVIAREKEEELRGYFSSVFVDTARDFDRYLSVSAERELAEKAGALAVYEAGEGGIYKALWDLGEELETGFDVYLRDIPVKQETIEIANYFDIDPYKLLSGGSLLIVCESGYDMVRVLQSAGINAAVTGRTNGTRDRVIVNAGLRRFISPRDRDEIYKIGEKCDGETGKANKDTESHRT